MNDVTGTPANGDRAASQVAQQLRSMLRHTPVDGGFRITLHIDASLNILGDHFRDAPILPGICLVRAVLLGLAGCRSGVTPRLRELRYAKFLRAVAPGDQVDIDAQMTDLPDGTVSVKAKATIEGSPAAQMSLVAGFREADQATGGPAQSGA